jgi:hypothetical protein
MFSVPLGGDSQSWTMRTACAEPVGKGFDAEVSGSLKSQFILYHHAAGFGKPLRSKEPKVEVVCGQPPKLGSP